jgi:serine/threonine-protein kinase
LKKTTLDGPPLTLAKVADHRGIAWLDRDTIIFAPFAAQGLYRIPASGGDPVAVTRLAADKGERTHRWPIVLPGGKTVLFTVGTYGSPDSYENTPALMRWSSAAASGVRYSRARASCAMWQAGWCFHAAVSCIPCRSTRSRWPSRKRRPFSFAVWAATSPQARFTSRLPRTGRWSTFPDSILGGVRRVLAWVDRKGVSTPLMLPPDTYNDLRISPDGDRVAVIVGASGSGDVWIHDFRRGTFTPADVRYHQSPRQCGRRMVSTSLLRVDRRDGTEDHDQATARRRQS